MTSLSAFFVLAEGSFEVDELPPCPKETICKDSTFFPIGKVIDGLFALCGGISNVLNNCATILSVLCLVLAFAFSPFSCFFYSVTSSCFSPFRFSSSPCFSSFPTLSPFTCFLRSYSAVCPSVLHRLSIDCPSFRWRTDGDVMKKICIKFRVRAYLRWTKHL